MKRLWLVFLALVLLAGCASTQRNVDALRPTAAPGDAVAQLTYRNNTVEYISRDELNAFADRLGQLNPQGAPPPPIALDILLSRKLMLYLAHTTDTQASPEEIERLVSNLTQDSPNGPSFCAERVQRTTNDKRALLNECAQTLGFQNETELRNFIAEELTINKATAQQAPKDLIRTAHILMEKYEDIAPVYDRVQRNPANFAEIAREVSIDPGSKDRGGELPPFNEQGLTEQGDQFNTTFVSNTLQLKEEFQRTGEAISQPFQTENGWHIVKILGLEASSQGPNNSVSQFRSAVLDRALKAQPADLSQPDTGDVPLLGVVQVLDPALRTPQEPLPPQEVLPEATPTEELETTAVPLEEGPATAEPAPIEETPAAPEATATP